jgi:uncharacterized protein
MTMDKAAALARIVGVEEHVAFPELINKLPEATFVERGYLSRERPFGPSILLDKLADTDARISALDEAGVTVQVLSYPLAGADLLPPRESMEWALQANAALAARVEAHPKRYAAFAHLPLSDPEAAADELERAVTELGFKGALVNGSTDGRYLDDPSFAPVLDRAAKLDVPIYLHPAPSPKAARDALYGGLSGNLGFWMSVSGWGWHADTATHALRLVLSGAFDRHPNLKVIIGHLGEGLQVMLPRLDQQFHQFAGFEGIPSEILRKHVWVSIGGFFMMPSFLAALDAFGPDRLLYSVDYPFGSLERGRAFLDQLPVDADILAKITHRNADQLLRLPG